jgi:NADPH-dependent 2,4-dienoyl-CoA reductase/sulfur reductase-like enzyme
LDSERKRLALKSGGEFGFDKLIIATGARVRTLDIPGARLVNVHYLRSLEDSKSIRNSAGNVKRAVVVGSGFIGMEVTAVLAQKGIETTMVLRDDRIWKNFFTPQMSQFFEAYYAERGVLFAKNAMLKELRGDGHVESAELADGETIPCEMVVAGIGVRPVTEVLANSGIEVADGVVVNEYLQTNRPDIFAAGDIANYRDVLFGKRRRVEHWDNAVSQGQYCARALMGERAPFKHVPYFFSDVFDLSYEFWGDPSDAEAVIHRGDFSSNSFSVWWMRNKTLVAAFTMNRPDEEREAAPKWIESKQNVSASKLGDPLLNIEAAVIS